MRFQSIYQILNVFLTHPDDENLLFLLFRMQIMYTQIDDNNHLGRDDLKLFVWDAQIFLIRGEFYE